MGLLFFETTDCIVASKSIDNGFHEIEHQVFVIIIQINNKKRSTCYTNDMLRGLYLCYTRPSERNENNNIKTISKNKPLKNQRIDRKDIQRLGSFN